MGLFSAAKVIEWKEFRDDVIFCRWKDSKIKRKSRLILQPGQAAVFLDNGVVKGIFTDPGDFNVGSEIVPLLDNLKGFRFGFDPGIRAELVFVNMKEITIQWGTKNPVMVPFESIPGGVPVRGFGTYQLKVSNTAADLIQLLTETVGSVDVFTVADVRKRIDSILDQLLMKHLVNEGKNLANLQANSEKICREIQSDLDYEMVKIGLTVNGFTANSFSYPQELQNKIGAASLGINSGSYSAQTQTVYTAAQNTAASAGAQSVFTQNIQPLHNGYEPQSSPAGYPHPNHSVPHSVKPGNNPGYSHLNDPGPAHPKPGSSMPGQGNGPNGSASAGSSMRFCPYCGAPLQKGARFCVNCGKPV